jgi:hypothetical protein
LSRSTRPRGQRPTSWPRPGRWSPASRRVRSAAPVHRPGRRRPGRRAAPRRGSASRCVPHSACHDSYGLEGWGGRLTR